MTHPTIHEQLESQKLKVFGCADSLPEALKGVQELLPDVTRGDLITALYLYHNSLLLELQKTLKAPAPEPVKGIQPGTELFRGIQYAFNVIPNKRLDVNVGVNKYKDTYAIASALGRVERGEAA